MHKTQVTNALIKDNKIKTNVQLVANTYLNMTFESLTKKLSQNPHGGVQRGCPPLAGKLGDVPPGKENLGGWEEDACCLEIIPKHYVATGHIPSQRIWGLRAVPRRAKATTPRPPRATATGALKMLATTPA